MPTAKATAAEGMFTVAEMDAQLSSHFASRPEHQTFSAYSVAQLDNTGIQAINR